MTLKSHAVETLLTPEAIPVANPGGIYNLTFHKTLANLGTSAADLISGLVLGHRFKILSLQFVTSTAGTGSGATQTFNLEIGTTNLTGGVLNLTLANQQTTYGQITSATPITGNNEGSATDAISLEMAAGGTAFTAGAGSFVIRVQNLDG